MNYKKFGKFIIAIASILFITLVLLLFYFERDQPQTKITNLFDAIWFSIVTITTVGYGDVYPVTVAGRIIGVLIVLTSFLTMGYMVGNLSNKIRKFMEEKKLGFYGTDFENHVVIIGWDKFGQQVTDQIINANHKVAIITNNKDDIDLIYDLYNHHKVFALFSDYNNLDSMKKLNIEKSASVFVNFPDDTETLVYLINVKQKFADLRLVVSLNNSNLKETFASAGVTYAISKNEIASKLVASYIFEPDVASFTEDIMSTAIDKTDFDIQEYMVLEKNPFFGKKYNDAFVDLKLSYNCILIGISKFVKDNEYKLVKNPSEDILVEDKDFLLIISNGVAKKEVEKAFGVKEGRLNW
ncbi:MAG: NAD-binding protein [Bacteroidetes bacterium]|nr:NAD-binding protein [Bacteroidota bacterium]